MKNLLAVLLSQENEISRLSFIEIKDFNYKKVAVLRSYSREKTIQLRVKFMQNLLPTELNDV